MENLSVSLVHSVSSSVLSTTAVALAIARGGLEGVLLPGDDLAAVSAGITVSYMVVDLFDALVTKQAPVKLPIIAHHLTIIAVMLLSNFNVSRSLRPFRASRSLMRPSELYCPATPYPLACQLRCMPSSPPYPPRHPALVSQRRGELLLQAGLICEINSVFLHVRALMKLLGMRMRDPVYLVAWMLAWVTFVITRVAIHFSMLVWMILNFDAALPMIDTNSVSLTAALAMSAGICLFDLAMAADLWFAMASDRRRAAAEAAAKDA